MEWEKLVYCDVTHHCGTVYLLHPQTHWLIYLWNAHLQPLILPMYWAAYLKSNSCLLLVLSELLNMYLNTGLPTSTCYAAKSSRVAGKNIPDEYIWILVVSRRWVETNENNSSVLAGFIYMVNINWSICVECCMVCRRSQVHATLWVKPTIFKINRIFHFYNIALLDENIVLIWT